MEIVTGTPESGKGVVIHCHRPYPGGALPSINGGALPSMNRRGALPSKSSPLDGGVLPSSPLLLPVDGRVLLPSSSMHRDGGVSSSTASSPLIIQPISKAEHHDIILEDGRNAKKHVGNIVLGNFIVERQQGYKNIAPTNRKEKNNYICNLIGEIEKTGGRFLRYHPSGLRYEIADADFVYQCIQRRLLRKKRKKKQAVPSSSVMAVEDAYGYDTEEDSRFPLSS